MPGKWFIRIKNNFIFKRRAVKVSFEASSDSSKLAILVNRELKRRAELVQVLASNSRAVDLFELEHFTLDARRLESQHLSVVANYLGHRVHLKTVDIRPKRDFVFEYFHVAHGEEMHLEKIGQNELK